MKGTKKLLMSVVALVITLAMATTATYAWFTVNGTVDIAGFDVNVSSDGDGLYVRQGGTGEYATSTTITPGAGLKLIPIKATYTTGTLTFNKMTSFSSAGFVATTAATENTNYLKVQLDFSATRAGDLQLRKTNSKIAPKSGSTATKVNLWKDFTADKAKYSELSPSGVTTVTKDTAVDVRAAWAARVAFVSNENTPTVVLLDLFRDGTNNLQLEYMNNLMGYSWEQTNKDNLLIPSTGFTATEATNGILGSDVKLGALNADNKITINMYIWLEGSDSSCFNAILADVFTVALQFGLAAK